MPVRLIILCCLLIGGQLSVGVEIASADVIDFIVTGAAGEGLLEGNVDPPTGESGSGGIGATGLSYNTVTNLLHVDIEWGSGNGYTDMSRDVLRVHLHGPTAGSGPDAFGQTAPLLITLSSTTDFDASASSGGLSGNFFVDQADEQALLDNRTYINVHLTDTDTGAIRGYVIAVPEPGGVTLLALLSALWIGRRRKLFALAQAA